MKIVGIIAVMIVVGLAILVLAGGIGLISWIGMLMIEIFSGVVGIFGGIVGIFGSVIGMIGSIIGWIFGIFGFFVGIGLKIIFSFIFIGLLIFVIWKVSNSRNDKY